MNTDFPLEKLISWDTVSNAAIVWLILVSLFFSLISTILSFHWKHYGVTDRTRSRLRKVYFTVSLGLFTLIAITSAIYFNS